MSLKIVFSPGEKVSGTRWTVLSEAEKKNGERMYNISASAIAVRLRLLMPKI